MKRLLTVLALMALVVMLGACEGDRVTNNNNLPPDETPSDALTRVTWSATAVAFTSGVNRVDIEVTNRHRVDPYSRALRIEAEIFGEDGVPIEKQSREFPAIEGSEDLDIRFTNLTAGARYRIDVHVFAKVSDDVNAGEDFNPGEPIFVQT